jgi:hypothetical protein
MGSDLSFGPEIYGQDYLTGLQKYATLPNRKAADLFRADTLFDRPYDTQPEQGMADIFALGHAMSYLEKLTDACNAAEPKINVGNFIAAVAAKHHLPLPPNPRAKIPQSAGDISGPDGPTKQRPYALNRKPFS